jgi:3',5'-cyclic AMP phosphodiesterase CpdA
MVRVVHISDTHIGRERALFMRNWQPVLEWVRQQNPSLILHSGDITLDGADVEADFDYCVEVLATLPAPYLGVAGNHDVGTAPRDARQPVDAARLARWERHFGPDRWVHDLEDWRLIGFDSMIMGSGLPQEEAQFAWIEETMAAAGGRRIAWFCHQPLFIHGYDDGDNGYWSVAPEPRKRLEALSRRFDIGLVGSGHLHISRDMLIDGTQYVWCPSTAFTVGATQPPMPGEKVLGAVTYDFEGRSVRFERVHLPVLDHMWIEDVVEQVYPK